MSLSDALVKGRIGDGAAPRWVGRREVVRVGRPGRRVPLAVGRGVDTRLAGPAGGRARAVMSSSCRYTKGSRGSQQSQNRSCSCSVPDWSSGGFARGVAGDRATATSMTPAAPDSSNEDAASAATAAVAAVDGATGSRCCRSGSGGDGGRVYEERKVIRRKRDHAASARSGHWGDCTAQVHANRHL